MPSTAFISPDDIRKGFSKAMSDMYRDEVPLYGALMELVADINRRMLDATRAWRNSCNGPAKSSAWTWNATAPFAWVPPPNWRPSAACSR